MRLNISSVSMMRAIYPLIIALLAGCSPRETSWVALGDSITYLNEHPDETGNRITAGYMTRVVRKLPHIHYTNKGFNGWTAGEVAREIHRLGLAKADLYTVFLGTNDWWRGRPIGTLADYQNNAGHETFFGSLRIITDYLKSLNERAQIVLLTPMQRVDFVYISNMTNNAYGSYRKKNNQSLADFAAAISQVGKLEGFEVIDLYNDSGITHENLVRFKRLRDPVSGEYKNHSFPDFVDKPFNPLSDEYPYPLEAIDMTYDGLHPSDKGYDVIANMLIDVLK